MLRTDRHRLLKRQLRKSNFSPDELEKLSDFIDLVDKAYNSFDQDMQRLETILEESSKELFKANQYLKHKHETAKSRLKNIVNTINGVIFQTDEEGRFIYLNNAWKGVTGISVKKSLNRSFKELLSGMNRREKLKIQRFLTTEGDEYKTVVRYFKPNKQIKFLEVHLSRIYDERGEPNGTIGTITDVTSLKETEIELNKASQAKDDFLATMSHEIRTPLNAVIGLSNILLMNKYLPNQKEDLNALKYSGEHLLGLVNNLLDINKLQSGAVHYVEDVFSLDEVIEELKANFKFESRNEFIVFKISRDPKVPDSLLGDRMMLVQVLKNLLSNAFKFTEEGLVQLSIKLINDEDGQVTVHFEVLDTGIGVAEEKQKVIFDSFVQEEQNTSRLYGGTGLGLSISKKILKIQNSELKIASTKGKGSVFSFSLDFRSVQPKMVVKNDRVSKKTTVEPINLKVLVAEDNRLNQLVLKKLFDKWNVYFHITNNGKELLEVLETEDFDLILMDLQMPILDGYETTKIIRAMEDPDKRDIPIIALTAFAQEDIKVKTAVYKMDGFMTKPFDPNDFHQLLSFYGNDIQNVG